MPLKQLKDLDFGDLLFNIRFQSDLIQATICSRLHNKMVKLTRDYIIQH